MPIILIIGFVYSIWQSRCLSEKFEKTKLNISSKQLFEVWGKPDNEFDLNLSYDQRHIIKYKDLFGDNYIFASKKGEEFITEKYIDD
jgi:hypothetical protein